MSQRQMDKTSNSSIYTRHEDSKLLCHFSDCPTSNIHLTEALKLNWHQQWTFITKSFCFAQIIWQSVLLHYLYNSSFIPTRNLYHKWLFYFLHWELATFNIWLVYCICSFLLLWKRGGSGILLSMKFIQQEHIQHLAQLPVFHR